METSAFVVIRVHPWLNRLTSASSAVKSLGVDHRLRRAELAADAAAVAQELIDPGMALLPLGDEGQGDAAGLETGLAAHAGLGIDVIRSL